MMSAGNLKLAALRVVDPAAVVSRVKLAIKTHNGVLTMAARELGISKRTLDRWIKAHELERFVASVRGGA